jgi:hypothetical protein
MVIQNGEKRTSEFGFFLYGLYAVRFASFEKLTKLRGSDLVEEDAHTYFCQIFLPGNLGYFCYRGHHQH